MQEWDYIDKLIIKNDIRGLRETLGNTCYTSRDFSSGEFDKTVDYIIGKGIKIKDDSLIGNLISEGKTSYTDEDFARAIFELKRNFCDERIADVKKIGKTLYKKDKAPVNKPTPNQNPERTKSPKPSSHQNESAFPMWAKVLVAVIIIVAVLYLLLGRK